MAKAITPNITIEIFLNYFCSECNEAYFCLKYVAIEKLHISWQNKKNILGIGNPKQEDLRRDNKLLNLLPPHAAHFLSVAPM